MERLGDVAEKASPPPMKLNDLRDAKSECLSEVESLEPPLPKRERTMKTSRTSILWGRDAEEMRTRTHAELEEDLLAREQHEKDNQRVKRRTSGRRFEQQVQDQEKDARHQEPGKLRLENCFERVVSANASTYRTFKHWSAPGDVDINKLDDLLKPLPVFHKNSAVFTDALMDHVQLRMFNTGQVVFTEGMLNASLFVVIHGEVILIIEDQEIMTLKADEYFGETFLLGLDVHTHCAMMASTQCVLAELERKDFREVAERYPIDRKFFQKMFERNRSNTIQNAGTLCYRCSIFSGLSETTMQQLDSGLLRRFFFPGQCLLEEGDCGSELYILVRGSAKVKIAGKIVRQDRRGSLSEFEGDYVGSLLEGESADKYLVVAESGLKVNRCVERSSDVIATVPYDEEITVVEVGPTVDGRLRARIEEPSGWVSLWGDRCIFARPQAMSRSVSIDTLKSGEMEKQVLNDNPICFGELGLLGLQASRSATVEAVTPCHVRVLYQHIFRSVLQQNNEGISSSHMGSLLKERSLGSSIKVGHDDVLRNSSIFTEAQCSSEFLDFVCSHLEDCIYLPGQTIIDEAADDRCMYILDLGSVNITKEGQQIAQLARGAVFGEVTVLGLAQKRSSSVIAIDTCWMQVLHQSAVIRGLEIFPDQRKQIIKTAFRRQESNTSADQEPGRFTKRTSDSDSAPEFMKVLRKAELFSELGTQFLTELNAISTVQIFMTGEKIIEEGDSGDSMFVMVSGSAGVYVSETEGRDVGTLSRVGTLKAGAISGELAMMGVSQIRSATIEADTICSMWEITQETGMAILQRYPDAQKHFKTIILAHLERTVPARILPLPMFRHFDRKLRTLLGLYCERSVYFPNSHLAREGHTGDHLFILNQGFVILEKKGTTIKTYTSGAVFGTTVMLGVHRAYFYTIISLQTCHVLSITRTSYLHALEHYSSKTAARHFKRSEEKAEAELREMIQRVFARKHIRKKYQGMMDMMKEEKPEELLSRYFKEWGRVAHRGQREALWKAEKLEKCQASIESWLKKRAPLAKEEPLEQSMPTKAAEKLPKVARALMERSAQLQDIVDKWPALKPSPHYNLRVWDVLSEAMEKPKMANELLPVLATSMGFPMSASTMQSQDSKATFASDWSWFDQSDISGAPGAAQMDHPQSARLAKRLQPLPVTPRIGQTKCAFGDSRPGTSSVSRPGTTKSPYQS